MDNSTNRANNVPSDEFDIVSVDGHAIRRGYLEVIFDEYHGVELTEAEQQHPAFLVQVYERQGREDSVTGYRVFATSLPPDLTTDERLRIIRKTANKITEDLRVSAFTSDIELWSDEWARFAEYAREAELSWFKA